MKFVGVREFKQDVVKYLHEGNEVVVMKRKKPIARLTPVKEKTAEKVLLENRSGPGGSRNFEKGGFEVTRPGKT